MLQIMALLFGLASWTILLFSIAKRKQRSKSNLYQMYLVSWMLCTFSIYIPLLCQYASYAKRDYDSVIDCTSTYFLAASVLLGVSLMLTVISLLLSRDK